MANILVVDDDINICELIKNSLIRDGHTVNYLNSVLDLTPNDFKPFELILLDVMMPNIDGFTFCYTIRQSIDVPIIFITAKTMEKDIIEGLSVGADDYIKKPFSISELRARISAHLRREHRVHHQTLLFKNIRLDLSGKKVFVNNTPIILTKSEYEICEFLARNKGQVFSLEHILEEIFGYDSKSDIAAIRVHVKNIRSKFTKLSTCPIETVWGVGYTWK